MDELASYRLSDFILFSQSTYFRLFELYNQSIWPVHILALLFSVVLVYTFWKKPVWGGRVAALLLVLSWCWIAIAFLYQRFYQIHLAANIYAAGFIAQALLMLWFGVNKNQLVDLSKQPWRRVTANTSLLLSIAVYPFIAVLSGRSWQQFEMFALAPDPTAIATIAVLLLYKSPVVLFVIPLLWLIISAVTLSVM